MTNAWTSVSSCALALVALGCNLATNYTDPDGPRYSGDYVGDATEVPGSPDRLRIVSYNLEYGDEVDTAIVALGETELRGADVILMQEMDGAGVERIAEALGLRYVYYPSSIHEHGRDFGNAVLSPWPIASDHKVVLPHLDPFNDRLRTATGAVVEVRGRPVLAYSTHLSVPSLGLGARLEQTAAVIAAADGSASRPPVVIGGDLNTGDPSSGEQTVALFAEHDLQWATSDAGSTVEFAGRCFTLDYVFVRGLMPESAGVYRGDAGSDHQPMWAELTW